MAYIPVRQRNNIQTGGRYIPISQRQKQPGFIPTAYGSPIFTRLVSKQQPTPFKTNVVAPQRPIQVIRKPTEQELQNWPINISFAQRIKEVGDAQLNYWRKQKQKKTIKEMGVDERIFAPKNKGFFEETKTALVRSYYRTILPTIGTLAENLALSPEMVKWGQKFADESAAQVLKNPKLLPSPNQTGARQVANITGEMAGFI